MVRWAIGSWNCRHFCCFSKSFELKEVKDGHGTSLMSEVCNLCIVHACFPFFFVCVCHSHIVNHFVQPVVCH